MKAFVIGFLFIGIACTFLNADIPARAYDGHRNFMGSSDARGAEKLSANYTLPCDAQEAYALEAGLTPVVLQLTPSVKRVGRIFNTGTTLVYYRVANWGLPPDWTTVKGGVSAGSGVDIDLSGAQQLWTWSAAVQTPAPSYIGCFAVNAPVFVATLTATPTYTVTPTASPTPTN